MLDRHGVVTSNPIFQLSEHPQFKAGRVETKKPGPQCPTEDIGRRIKSIQRDPFRRAPGGIPIRVRPLKRRRQVFVPFDRTGIVRSSRIGASSAGHRDPMIGANQSVSPRAMGDMGPIFVPLQDGTVAVSIRDDVMAWQKHGIFRQIAKQLNGLANALTLLKKNADHREFVDAIETRSLWR